MVGFNLVLLAYLCLSVQNVLIRVIFAESSIFGWFSLGGWLSPSIGHSLLILLIRTIFMLPLMIAIAPKLYPLTGQDLKKLAPSRNSPLLLKTVGSSCFLFLSLALLFVAFSKVSAGIGTALFFIHPAITVLLAWQIFGDRPTLLRFAVIITVFSGSFLVAPNFSSAMDNHTLLGVGAGLAAGGAYAVYGVLAQICFQEIHPVPFTVASLFIMLVLFIISIFLVNIDVEPTMWFPLWVASFVAAVLTLIGQLLINFGIHLSNASLTSLVGASNPALTALFAWLLIQEALQGRQIVGILFITLGVATLGIEQIRR